MWFYGFGIFFFVAVLCIVAGAMAFKKRRDYDYGEDFPDETNEPEA
jgi:hypothetical protein